MTSKQLFQRLLMFLMLQSQCMSNEQSPVAASAIIEGNDNTGLPTVAHLRDDLLKKIWGLIIPWLLDSQSHFKTYFHQHPDYLFTPYPYNPYREPGASNVSLFPSDGERLKAILTHLQLRKKIHEQLLKASKFYLQNHKNQITLREKGLFAKFTMYHQSQINTINSLDKIVNNSPPLDEILRDYHSSNQVKKKRAKQIINQLSPYFLGSAKPAHQLIHLEMLSLKEPVDAEVIVYEYDEEDRFQVSPYLRPSAIQKNQTIREDDIKNQRSHATAVAAIIAAKSELAHLRGVVPGARVLSIRRLTPENLEKIKESKARVINMSFTYRVPRRCWQYFKDREGEASYGDTQDILLLRYSLSFPSKTNVVDPSKEGQCATLWDFVTLVKAKDMIIIQAAGNDGLQLEEMDWKSGEIKNDFTNLTQELKKRNAQYTVNEFDHIDWSFLIHQIPQLKKRIVLVGNVLADGVTIANTSNLPGAFADDFIYAPSEAIKTLYASEFIEKPGYYSELGEFGGTSGAAPRVAGVFVLLGKLFPDLSMTSIRECVLESGTPFWKSPQNKFSWLQAIGDTAYGRRIYGQGLINAAAAYHLCLDKRKKHRLSALDLATVRYPDEALYNQIISGDLVGLKKYYDQNPQKKILDQRDKKFKWPVEIAIQNKNAKIVNYLLPQTKLSKTETARIIFWALTKKLPLSLMNIIIKKGTLVMDPEIRDENGNTPLIVASMKRLPEVVQLLINKKSDEGPSKLQEYINLANKDGQTALSIAELLGEFEIVDILQNTENPSESTQSD